MEATQIQILSMFRHRIVGKTSLADGSSVTIVFRKTEGLPVHTFRHIGRGEELLYAFF